MNASLLIRADAYPELGTGHVMRCIALAQAWQQQGGEVTFAIHHSVPQSLIDRLTNEGYRILAIHASRGSLEDAQEIVAYAARYNAQWIVIDGYHFDESYQRFVKSRGFQVLFLDDYGHAGTYCADIVLNQNLHAHETLYPNRATSSRLLLGPGHALLRREFWSWQGWHHPIVPVARRILVTLGGADSANVTLTVVNALKQIASPRLEVIIVVGAINTHWQSLIDSVHDMPHTVQFLRNIISMPELMAEADLAIASAGSTCWELMFMGVPTLLIEIADNQRMIAASLAERAAAIRLGYYSDLTAATITEACETVLQDQELRWRLSRTGHELVDGRGALRVVQAMQEDTVRLRPVTIDDIELIWHWANEPTVRAVSFHSEPIPWDDHVRWFTAKLKSAATHMYIAVHRSGEPIGQVRFDINGETATISISLAPQYRGQGYGTLIVRRSVSLIVRQAGVKRVRALVKPTNQASLRMFEKVGFVPHHTIYDNDHIAVELYWHDHCQ